MTKIYSIKEVSELTGLTHSTIRYYEKEGLIPNIDRDKNSIRQYTKEDIVWIDFLSKLKNMEMPISEMKKYATLRAQGPSTIIERKTLLENHKKRLAEKAASIQNNLKLLDKKIKIYEEMRKENEQ